MTLSTSRHGNVRNNIPFWFLITLLAQTVVLWLLVVDLMWFAPALYRTVYTVPIRLASVSFAAIGVLFTAAILAAVFIYPHSARLQSIFVTLQQMRSYPLTLLLCAITYVPALLILTAVEHHNILLGLLFLITSVQLYLLDPNVWRSTATRHLTLVSLGILGMGVVLRAWLMRSHWYWTDEGYYLSTIANMLRGGPITPITHRMPSTVRIFPLWGYGLRLYWLWAEVVGYGIAQARLLSFLLGLLSLPLIYRTASIWYGRTTAVVTVSLSSLTILFLQSTTARPDGYALAATSLVLFLHVYAVHTHRRWLHFLTGICSVLAMQTHGYTLVFVPTLGAFYLLDYIRQSRQQRSWLAPAPLWFFLAGAVPFLVLYAFTNFWLAFPHGPTSEYSGLFTTNLAIPDPVLLPTRYLLLWNQSPWEVMLIFAAVIAALIRRTKADIHWLTLFFALNVSYWPLSRFSEVAYTIHGLPILIGSAGALITYGLKRHEQAGSIYARLAYLGMAAIFASHAYRTVGTASNVRESFEARRADMFSYIREHISTNSVLIGPAFYYPYLQEYTDFIHPYYGEAAAAPSIAGEAPEAYWLGIMLQTWPVAWIDAPDYYFEQLEVHQTYMHARHAQEVAPSLWVVGDSDLVRIPVSQSADLGPNLQMVAFSPPSEPTTPQGEVLIHTLWVTHSTIPVDMAASISLIDDSGARTTLGVQPLISGWADSTTSHWQPDQFHDVDFAVVLPGDLNNGSYLLRIEAGEMLGGQLTSSQLCEPNCSLDLSITVQAAEE